MKIGSHDLSTNGAYIIAEIGSNHNQDKNLAFDTIDAAIDCGANAVKFQSINIDKLYFKPTPKIIELHKKIDLKESWHYELKSYCDKKGIDFFSSPTYLSSIDILEEINVPLYKLASAQIGTFPQLVKKVISIGKPVIFSTGISTVSEIKNVISIFKKHNNNKYILLHCNSIYPTPYKKVNLNCIPMYKSLFGSPVGFSDHSDGFITSVGAVALGAQVIEKHFVLDKSVDVPDAPFSLEPKNFKLMVEYLRIVEKTIGINPREDIEEEESGFKKSIITRLILKGKSTEGDYLKEDDFLFLRSASGISCTELNKLIKKKAKYSKNISKQRELHESDITY